MNPVLLPFPLQQGLAGQMADPLPVYLRWLDWRRLPDDESLVIVDDALERRPLKAANAGRIRCVF